MRVVFLTQILTQYRVPFHEGVRARLAEFGIQYDLIFGQPDKEQAEKGDCVSVSWGKQIINHYIRIGRYSVIWQPALKDIWNCDLVVIGQENRLLINYIAQTCRIFTRAKVALFGHGRNFQVDSELGLAERWKRFWATRCDWWFAYTDKTRKLIESYGFPSEHITVFHNAIDTSEIRRLARQIDDTELAALRRRLGITTNNVAIYVGGLYHHKRIDFLIEAAVEIRRQIPDFILIVVGNGSDRERIEVAAAQYPWLLYLGPLFGREKVAILRLGRAFVMPGLVGLAILDCAAVGLPIVTTAYPFHSPEIAYLEPGRNGLIVEDWRNSIAYAHAVVSVLLNNRLHAEMANGTQQTAKFYTIERMSQCFADGIVAALAVRKP